MLTLPPVASSAPRNSYNRPAAPPLVGPNSEPTGRRCREDAVDTDRRVSSRDDEPDATHDCGRAADQATEDEFQPAPGGARPVGGAARDGGDEWRTAGRVRALRRGGWRRACSHSTWLVCMVLCIA